MLLKRYTNGLPSVSTNGINYYTPSLILPLLAGGDVEHSETEGVNKQEIELRIRRGINLIRLAPGFIRVPFRHGRGSPCQRGIGTK